MTYRELVREYIKKVNDEFAHNTYKLYSTKLDQLNRDINNNNEFDDKFEYLYNYNKVFEYVKQFKTDNSLAFLNAIIIIIKDKPLLKIYKEKRDEYSKIKKEKYLNNERSPNFTEYKDLLEKTNIISFSNMNVKEAVKKFLLYMAVRYPIRLELHDLPIIRVKKNTNPNKNYFYISNNRMEIIMNSFKNVKSFGKTIIVIDKVDEDIIKKYLKFLTFNKIKHMNLIENVIGDEVFPISQITLAKKLKVELNKLFKNRNLTMNSLRQSYETDLICRDDYKTMTNLEKTKFHNRLLHNMESAFKNYNKV